MTGASKIEWTEQTWNPIVGCSIKSPGCAHCYAMTMAARIEAMGNQPRYAGTTRKVNSKAVWTGKLAQAPDATLLAPLKRTKPTMFFVNSMSDLFHEAVPDEWIDRVFAVMALAPQHTFQVLTKRSERMRDYFLKRQYRDIHPLEDRELAIDRAMNDLAPAHWCKRELQDYSPEGLPLPNVWLGVSAERQKEADERIPHLLATPAAVRWVSAEPLLGPVKLRQRRIAPKIEDAFSSNVSLEGIGLDWLVVGGESGPDARLMHPDWARSLRDQCAVSGVPFFFKQWGAWSVEIDRDRDDPDWRQPYSSYREPAFQILNLAGDCGFHGERVHVMRACSKRSAGRLLDGVTHDAMPEARA